GLTRFDTSVAGLGGSPFAAGAGGNLSTEDFVSFLDALGIEHGYDLGALVQISAALCERLGREPASKVRSANVKAAGR
ncbi:MAG TPA: hydroxymethylglutaryl-CoA lyase, partial [Acidimicrobiales bacterium]|nr:hydroxymethylglutaryl-CoA lyase [Acidimicrobiales bacterium]